MFQDDDLFTYISKVMIKSAFGIKYGRLRFEGDMLFNEEIIGSSLFRGIGIGTIKIGYKVIYSF